MKIKNILAIGLLSIMLVACGGNDQAPATETSQQEEASQSQPAEKETEESQTENSEDTNLTSADSSELTITDNHGEVTVPKNPQKVAVLDSRSFEILEKFGVKPVAVPKDVLPDGSSYKNDETIVNIGNHREPNLEALAAADPDLVILGQRFASYYEDIKALLPNASIIDLDIDVSEEAASPGDNLLTGFINSTQILGQIFDNEDMANEIIGNLEEALDAAKSAYNGDPVMGVIVSASEIGYAAPSYGRVWGPIFDILDLKPALEVDGDSSDHKGDGISVEAIAQSNPTYLMVLDRDAATSKASESQPAEDVIENSPALADLDVIKEGKIYYAPKDTYTNESAITLTEILNGLAELFSK